MMRSLYSGVSGLKSHQTRMDVIGNNIANVNTTAYKSKKLNFSDMLYQTTQAATGPNASSGTGGTNPRQIGLGVKTAAINTTITTEGSTQSTGNPFDLKLTGEAFFVVSDGTNTYYTRDGSFDEDEAGNLVMSSTGYIVQGWGVDADGNILKGSVGNINLRTKSQYDAAATTAATVSGIIDANDTQLQTENGRLMNISVYDKSGYEYNLKFGILPSMAPSTDQRSILNTENEYTPKSPIYKVDTSKLTFRDQITGKELTASSAPAVLIERLETAVWDVVNSTTTSGVNTTGVSGTHNFGDKEEGVVTIDLATFLQNNSDLSIVDDSNLKQMTLLVDFSGGSGFTTTVSSYPLNDVGSIVSVNEDAVTSLYNASATTPTQGRIEYTRACNTVTSIKQTYADDDNNTVTEYVYRGDGNALTVGGAAGAANVGTIYSSDMQKLLSLADKSDTVTSYTTVESKEATTVEKGKYIISLLDMTDSTGKDVSIDALTNNGTSSWNLEYSPDDGKFSFVDEDGSDTFTVNLSLIDTNFEDLTVNMSDTNNEDNGGKSTVEGLKDDGYKQGNFSGASIGTDGIITAKYTNGMTATIGQICVATFHNPMGLENEGDNLYSETGNSGECVMQDIKASGIGYMTSGVLEMSNVDLSSEFTDMITTQRGFQANSRIITVSDTLLEELVNLKR